jgi:hypothetical protein
MSRGLRPGINPTNLTEVPKVPRRHAPFSVYVRLRQFCSSCISFSPSFISQGQLLLLFSLPSCTMDSSTPLQPFMTDLRTRDSLERDRFPSGVAHAIAPKRRGRRKDDEQPTKHRKTLLACDECRIKKTKCNGARPSKQRTRESKHAKPSASALNCVESFVRLRI